MADTGFELISIALIKSTFERPIELDFLEEEVPTTTSLKASFHQTEDPEPTVNVTLTVGVTIPTTNADEPMSVSVTMLGVFNIVGVPSNEVVNNFGNINGPAILYPFIRESIASLTMKADVPPVLLPTMNFAAAYNQSQLVKKVENSKTVKTTTKREALPSSKSRIKPAKE